jgi:hypothetical protein
MESFPRSSATPPWELPGVRAALGAPRPEPQLGVDWACVVFCTVAAPPALILAGLLHPGASPVAFWLAACVCFFTGLGLALRLEPLPPRRVFALRRTGDEIDMRDLVIDGGAEGADADWLELPGIVPGMSRPEILEQLAKLRERGDLSGGEYLQARQRLVGD